MQPSTCPAPAASSSRSRSGTRTTIEARGSGSPWPSRTSRSSPSSRTSRLARSRPLSSTTDRSSMTDRSGSQRGQVLVLFAGGLITLLLFAALAFDGGMVLAEHRDQQDAADAAALAGARYMDVPRDFAAAEAAPVNDAIVNWVVHAYHGEEVSVTPARLGRLPNPVGSPVRDYPNPPLHIRGTLSSG